MECNVIQRGGCGWLGFSSAVSGSYASKEMSWERKCHKSTQQQKRG